MCDSRSLSSLTGSTLLSFGELISTSNRVVAPAVTVTTSHPLVWTIDIDVTKPLC